MATARGDAGKRSRDIHVAVLNDVHRMFDGKSSAELAKLRASIKANAERAVKLAEVHSGRKAEAQGGQQSYHRGICVSTSRLA